MPKVEQIFPQHGPLFGDVIAIVAGLLVLDPHRLVQHGKGAVDEGDGVSGDEDEPIAETFLWVADVPAHPAAQQRRQQGVDFGA